MFGIGKPRHIPTSLPDPEYVEIPATKAEIAEDIAWLTFGITMVLLFIGVIVGGIWFFHHLTESMAYGTPMPCLPGTCS